MNIVPPNGLPEKYGIHPNDIYKYRNGTFKIQFSLITLFIVHFPVSSKSIISKIIFNEMQKIILNN